MAGKLWKDVRMYFGTYDFSTASVNVSVNLESLPLDPTVFTDAAQRVIAGNRQDSIEWAGLFNDGTSADAAGSAMIGSGTNNVISVLVGTATGDRAYAGTGYLLTAKAVARIGELVRQEMTIRPDQAWDVARSYGSGSANFTAETNTGTLDNSTATTAGGAFYLHLPTLTGLVGTLNVRIADSADNTSYAIVTSGSLTGIAGPTSIKSSIAGTIRRYTRCDIAGTGTITFVISLARV